MLAQTTTGRAAPSRATGVCGDAVWAATCQMKDGSTVRVTAVGSVPAMTGVTVRRAVVVEAARAGAGWRELRRERVPAAEPLRGPERPSPETRRRD